VHVIGLLEARRLGQAGHPGSEGTARLSAIVAFLILMRQQFAAVPVLRTVIGLDRARG
jgi:hypothetical protein